MLVSASMSIMRLWMRISNCSRESLSVNAERSSGYELVEVATVVVADVVVALSLAGVVVADEVVGD